MQDWEFDKTISMASSYMRGSGLLDDFCSPPCFPGPRRTQNSVWRHLDLTYQAPYIHTIHLMKAWKFSRKPFIYRQELHYISATQQVKWGKERFSNPSAFLSGLAGSTSHHWPMVGREGQVCIPVLRICNTIQKCWSVIKQTGKVRKFKSESPQTEEAVEEGLLFL